VNQVWVVLLHDLVHIEDDTVLLRKDASGADASAGRAFLALTVKVAAGLSPSALLARDACDQPWLDFRHVVEAYECGDELRLLAAA